MGHKLNSLPPLGNPISKRGILAALSKGEVPVVEKVPDGAANSGPINSLADALLTLNLAVLWTPSVLFADGAPGAWFDPSDLTTLFQDTAGTIPVAADGDPVGLILDKSGNGHHLSQATAAARPLYRTAGGLSWLAFDAVDDALNGTLPVADFGGNLSKTIVAALSLNSLASQSILMHYGGTAANGAFGFAPDNTTDGMTLFQYGPDLAGGASTAASTVYTAIKNGNDLSIRTNSALAVGPTSLAAANITADVLHIGSLNDGVGSYPLNGDLYGLIILAGTPDPTSAENWLSSKAGLA